MKKSFVFLIFLILCVGSLLSGCKKNDAKSKRSKEVIVYTYDSFVGEWGAGPGIAESFEKATGLKVTFIDCGDGLDILSRGIREKDDPVADVLLGLDNNVSAKVIDADLLVPYEPKNLKSIVDSELVSELNGGSKVYLTPYDYSHFAINFDTKSNLPEPKSLEDLTKPEYRGKLILMDPRTSTPGLGFAAWTLAVYGDDVADYWRRLIPSILTMSPSWSTGYGLYENGEAPLVISYTTSPAAGLEYSNTDQYKAIIFEEGHVRQIEGAGIVKNCKNPDGAKKFMDFLITEDAQNNMPLTQWMFPVNKNVKLPESYRHASIADKTLTYDAAAVDKAVTKIMKVINE